MEEEIQTDNSSYLNSANIKIRDLEEKQRLLKERVLMIGKNLIDFKEDLRTGQISIKKDIQEIKDNLKNIQGFIEMMSSEFSEFAKKEDLEILTKQVKMFQQI